MKNILITLLLTSWLFGCANLGDGKLNPEFTPEFKEAYAKVKPLIVDIGTILFFENPAKAQELIDKLTNSRTKVDNALVKYSLPEAVDEAKAKLLAECQWWCYLSSTRPYVESAGEYLDKLKEVETDELYTVTDIINELILALQNPVLSLDNAE